MAIALAPSVSARKQVRQGEPVHRSHVFSSKVGPIGVVESANGIEAIRVGYHSEIELRRDLGAAFPEATDGGDSAVAELLQRYALGERVSFNKVRLDTASFAPFRRRVTEECRRIGYGQTVTYTQLAARAGNEKAYRAAGNVMANNPWPIIVPCHRVLGAGGSLGGYSAPRGLAFKQLLIELERKASG